MNAGVKMKGGCLAAKRDVGPAVEIAWFTGFGSPYQPYSLLIWKNWFDSASRYTVTKELSSTHIKTQQQAIEFAKKLAAGVSSIPECTIGPGDRIVVNQASCERERLM